MTDPRNPPMPPDLSDSAMALLALAAEAGGQLDVPEAGWIDALEIVSLNASATLSPPSGEAGHQFRRLDLGFVPYENENAREE